MDKCRLALVIPNDGIRCGVESLISSYAWQDYETTAYVSWQAFLNAKRTIDLLLLDASNLSLETLESYLKFLHHEYPNIRVIVMRDELSGQAAMRIIKLYAKGYIPQSETNATLLYVLLLVNAGYVVLTECAVERARQLDRLRSSLKLEPKDLAILRMRAQFKPVNHIAQVLNIASRTVYDVMCHIRKGLRVKDNTVLINVVRKKQLIDVTKDTPNDDEPVV